MAAGAFLRQFNMIEASIPAISPQNAAPIPNNVMPDADTRIVIRAGSRCISSSKATFRLLPIVLNKANPAIANTSSFGNAKNNATIVAPNIPMNSQQSPAKIVAL